MSLELTDILITGRTYEEYEAFFALDAQTLQGRRVLDCPSGASSFIAIARERGIDAHGCDVIYGFERDAIMKRASESIETIYADTAWMQGCNYDFYGSIEQHRGFRERAVAKFEAHYNREHYHHVILPSLPFADKSFDMVLSSHLLFVYDDRLDYDFHVASIKEMMRVGREVRIFPLFDFKGNPSPFAPRIAEELGGEIVEVGFEFQRGARQMMVFGG